MKKLIPTLILSTMFAGTIRAEEYRAWVAARVVDSIATNIDIIDFLETTRMTDSQIVALFEKAGKDYDKYYQLRKETLQPLFDSGLRQWTYFKMVEKEAIKDRKSGKSPAFRVTAEQYNKAVNEIEDKAVRKYLDQRLGIVKARDLAGADLRNTGFPFRKDESNTDTYFRWFNLQKNRLMESFRVREVRRHEVFESNHGFEIYVRPTDMWDFGKKNNEFISKNLNGKSFDKASLLKIVAEKPELRVTLETLDALSLTDMSLANIAKINSNEAQRLSTELSKLFSNQNDKLLAQAEKYIGIAKQFKQKYSQSELEEKAKTSRENYLKSSGDYTDLVLSKIYELAQIIDESNSSEISAFSKDLSGRLHELAKTFSNLNETTNEQNAMYMAADLAVRSYKMQRTEKSEVAKSLDDLMGSILKFEVVKFAATQKNLVSAKSCDIKTYECQKKINDYLKEKEIEKGIERFRKQDLSFYDGLIEINPDGRDLMRGGEAFDWVLNNR